MREEALPDKIGVFQFGHHGHELLLQIPLGGGDRSRRIQFAHTYEDIISVENLLSAWKEFVRGKRKKKDVQEFQYRLMDNILELHRELKDGTYRHGGYKAFKISDPKPRDIHKASVRDRLLHHALYRQLYPFFDRTFIPDSYSCRLRKGTHRAMNRFVRLRKFQNHTRTCWSFQIGHQCPTLRGLPLGNLTSFLNIYMNESTSL